MNPEKWDAIAEAFDAGAFVPANGWDAWNAQAHDEAVTIRKALPDSVDVLLEVGCGVGRLTPALAILFPHVIACDTSAVCRAVTVRRCKDHGNVRVVSAAGAPYGSTIDAALVWGNLYDDDWSLRQISTHRMRLRRSYPLVLEGNAERWMLWSEHECVTFEA